MQLINSLKYQKKKKKDIKACLGKFFWRKTIYATYLIFGCIPLGRSRPPSPTQANRLLSGKELLAGLEAEASVCTCMPTAKT